MTDKRIKLPGSEAEVIVSGTDEQIARHEKILKARHKFALQYAKKKGWGTDVTKFSLAQVLEIRKQPEWKSANEGDELKLNIGS